MLLPLYIQPAATFVVEGGGKRKLLLLGRAAVAPDESLPWQGEGRESRFGETISVISHMALYNCIVTKITSQ
jgi:hypothetical protein